jgi:hypothetical protein
MRSRAVDHFVAATAVIALAAYVTIYARGYADSPIRSDGFSYYVFLPSAFIYGDLSLDALSRDWYGGAYPGFSAIRKWPTTGRWLDAVPVGIALMTMPFFLVAHLLSWWSNLPRDGFSFYYQHAAGLAGLTYFLAGLALVRQVLRRHFSDGVVLATLVTLTWGTNLFHYGVFDATFSHAFSFFLVALWLVVVERWWQRPSTATSAALGAVGGLIVLVRHTNAIFLVVPVLYGLSRWRDLPVRMTALVDRVRPLAIATVVAASFVVPQLVLYRWATGAWLVNPYQLIGQGFSVGSSLHVTDVLFSAQKGLFFWSPALLLAVLGAVVAHAWSRGIVWATAAVFAAQTLLYASWSNWQLGGSYGHRGFTDALALAAPMIASAYAWASARPRMRAIVAAFATAAVVLSIVQMIQYWIGIIPFDGTTWPQYRTLFLRFR